MKFFILALTLANDSVDELSGEIRENLLGTASFFLFQICKSSERPLPPTWTPRIKS